MNTSIQAKVAWGRRFSKMRNTPVPSASRASKTVRIVPSWSMGLPSWKRTVTFLSPGS
jgi:hypothetical protein